jgi:hypothetical protein
MSTHLHSYRGAAGGGWTKWGILIPLPTAMCNHSSQQCKQRHTRARRWTEGLDGWTCQKYVVRLRQNQFTIVAISKLQIRVALVKGFRSKICEITNHSHRSFPHYTSSSPPEPSCVCFTSRLTSDLMFSSVVRRFMVEFPSAKRNCCHAVLLPFRNWIVDDGGYNVLAETQTISWMIVSVVSCLATCRFEYQISVADGQYTFNQRPLKSRLTCIFFSANVKRFKTDVRPRASTRAIQLAEARRTPPGGV